MAEDVEGKVDMVDLLGPTNGSGHFQLATNWDCQGSWSNT